MLNSPSIVGFSIILGRRFVNLKSQGNFGVAGATVCRSLTLLEASHVFGRLPDSFGPSWDFLVDSWNFWCCWYFWRYIYPLRFVRRLLGCLWPRRNRPLGLEYFCGYQDVSRGKFDAPFDADRSVVLEINSVSVTFLLKSNPTSLASASIQFRSRRVMHPYRSPPLFQVA